MVTGKAMEGATKVLESSTDIQESYNEWIKTYNPIYFKCKECSLNFINKKYLNSHNCN